MRFYVRVGHRASDLRTLAGFSGFSAIPFSAILVLSGTMDGQLSIFQPVGEVEPGMRRLFLATEPQYMKRVFELDSPRPHDTHGLHT